MSPNIESTARDVLRLYPVKRAAFFGSAARGDMNEQSDIDMLVEFLPNQGGRNFSFFGLHAALEKAFGCHVDLLTYHGLNTEAKHPFREAVLRDEKVIYEHQG